MERERDIEKRLRCQIERMGGKFMKFVSPGNDGVPDRIVVFPGRAPVFVELKSDAGRLSALQEVQIRRLKELGQKVYVARGIDGVGQFFRENGFEETSKALDYKYGL